MLHTYMTAPGAIISRPFVKNNPYGEGFVIGRSHSTLSSHPLLYKGRYDRRFQVMFPEDLLVFETEEAAMKHRICRSKEVFA